MTGKVGRITTGGAVTEYDVPGDDPLPGAIVPGPDGALYVAERNDNVISRMTTAGEFTAEFELPREHADPVSMVKGVDGALYISEFISGVVSRMTFDGTFTKAYRIPGGFLDRVMSAPDGALWVAQGSRRQGLAARRRPRLPGHRRGHDVRGARRQERQRHGGDVHRRRSERPRERLRRARSAGATATARTAPSSAAPTARSPSRASTPTTEAGLAQGRRPHHRRRREGSRREGDELGDRPPLSRGHHAGTARRYSSYCAPYRSASVGSS